MNKHIDGYISGLPQDELHTPLYIAQHIYKGIYSRSFNGMNKLVFSNCKNDYEKIIFDNMYPLLGAYKIQKDMDIYKNEFINKLQQYIGYENIKYIRQNINMNDGTIKDSYGNDVKILKYIRKILKDEKEYLENFERLSFVQYYNTINSSNNDLFLVITNSIVSTIAMSSCAKEWSSCQRLTGDNHSKKVWGNLLDTQSLICYITDFTDIEISTKKYNNKIHFKHYKMYQRNVLRVLFDTSNKPYLLLDRSYPNDKYVMQMANIIQQLAKQNNMNFSIFYNYNSVQNYIYTSKPLIGLLDRTLTTLYKHVRTICPLTTFTGRSSDYYIYTDQRARKNERNQKYTLNFEVYDTNNIMTYEEFTKKTKKEEVSNEIE